MCGIVGLHLRSPKLYPRLGELLTGMLCEMESRGADSAGVAVYGDPAWTPAGTSTVSVVGLTSANAEIVECISAGLGAPVSVTSLEGNHLVHSRTDTSELLQAVRDAFPDALVAGFGTDVAVLKGVGSPQHLAQQWGLANVEGWQGVGHTRMATESAVTPSGAHPYAVGPDQCLVHNGSFSNHASIRRELVAAGARFDSQNDTEVGARFVAKELADGSTVKSALTDLTRSFDGFYTLLVSNSDSFAVVRDAIACKPAVLAETSEWVAMASEYRALAHLPGVENANIWEPEPEVIYAWSREKEAVA